MRSIRFPALLGLTCVALLAIVPLHAETDQPASAVAPTLQDLVTQEAALDATWEKMPLTQRHALFVTQKADLYGNYAPRSSNVFSAGENLLTYVEPVGFAWKDAGDGTLQFGLTLDFQVKTASGHVLAEQKAYQKASFVSRFKNHEMFMNLTLSLSGVEPGDYVLVYTLHDQASDKVSSFEQPFTIKG